MSHWKLMNVVGSLHDDLPLLLITDERILYCCCFLIVCVHWNIRHMSSRESTTFLVKRETIMPSSTSSSSSSLSWSSTASSSVLPLPSRNKSQGKASLAILSPPSLSLCFIHVYPPPFFFKKTHLNSFLFPPPMPTPAFVLSLFLVFLPPP